MKNDMNRGIFLAISAACLYAISTPFSKLLLEHLPPTLVAGFLYLGAGLGMMLLAAGRTFFRRTGRKQPSNFSDIPASGICSSDIPAPNSCSSDVPATNSCSSEARLTRAEFPFTIAMVLLDIAAPICLMIGLSMTSTATVSLLNNFEIVVTAIIALFVFREKISARLWLGILFVTASCLLLSVEDFAGFRLSRGAFFVLLACLCWGVENNCTRRLSSKDPLQIVMIKGIFSGLGSLAIGFLTGERILSSFIYIPCVLLLGFVAYGLSIYTYVYAQRFLGASRTSAYYAAAPFIGAGLSLALFRELPGKAFLPALLFMGIGAWLSSCDAPLHNLFTGMPYFKHIFPISYRHKIKRRQPPFI